MAQEIRVPPGNGSHPPPSSILATRVANGDHYGDFNQASFNQLLEESLGADENGRPNLGNDVAVNHTLICIVMKAGINAFIRDAKENPFQSRTDTAGKEAQFSCCLEVIRTAIERSPDVIHTRSLSDRQSRAVNGAPLYSELLPKLIPLWKENSSAIVKESNIKVFDAVLIADETRFKGVQRNTVFDFLLGCVSGKSIPMSPCHHLTNSPSCAR
jgi:serine/threonine-protein kinase ATR